MNTTYFISIFSVLGACASQLCAMHLVGEKIVTNPNPFLCDRIQIWKDNADESESGADEYIHIIDHIDGTDVTTKVFNADKLLLIFYQDVASLDRLQIIKDSPYKLYGSEEVAVKSGTFLISLDPEDIDCMAKATSYFRKHGSAIIGTVPGLRIPFSGQIPNRKLNPFWAIPLDKNGWRQTWMGRINDSFGFNLGSPHTWIYSEDLGWVNAAYKGTSYERGIWFYKPADGWLFSSDKAYPWAYSITLEKWISLKPSAP